MDAPKIDFLTNLRGSLRFREPPIAPVGEVIEKSAFDVAPPPPVSPRATKSGDPNYYQKLTNLFPAEALAIYGTGSAIFGGANLVVVVVGLVILLVLRIVATQPDARSGADWRAVAVATASYLLWATANDAHWLASLNTGLAPDAADIRKYAAFFGAALVLLAPVLAPEPAGAKA